MIIIGGGMAGLSSGIYLQMNGYDVHILEAHDKPGGLCTAWRRGGYTFDGCIHWLLGSSEGTPMHGVWRELIDLDSVSFVNHDHILDLDVGVPDARGDTSFHLYADIDRQERYLLEAAPLDARLIRPWMAAVRKAAALALPPVTKPAELRTWRDRLEMLSLLPLLPLFLRFGTSSGRAYSKKAKSPFLRTVLEKIFGDHEAAMLLLILQQAWYHSGCAGYPLGGSIPFIELFSFRFQQLGGTLRTRTPVKRILVEDGAAVGVELEDGTVEQADVVISAADGRWTLFDALEGRYLTKKLEDLYAGRSMPTFPSLIYVSLGIRGTLGRSCHMTRYVLAEPWTLPDGTVVNQVPIHAYDYDPTLAPEGCTTVTVMLESRGFEYWRDLRAKDRSAYRDAKTEVADSVIGLLEERLGVARESVEVVDVATPSTFTRYTGNWQGSYEGWLPTGSLLSVPSIPKELPGLKNFHMVGQWVEPGGGLPPAALHGRALAQVLCARDGKAFQLVPPERLTPSGARRAA